jgi:hypothetical protein
MQAYKQTAKTLVGLVNIKNVFIVNTFMLNTIKQAFLLW